MTMEAKTESVVDAPVVAPPGTVRDMSDAESLNLGVEEMFVKVDQLEQKFNEVQQFYSTSNAKHLDTRVGSLVKEKERDKFSASSFKKKQQDIASREAVAAQRMQELMRQFGMILRQVIEKPMDFSTIKCRMEAKDGTGYKNVREVCADVRLIFKNAMKYNKERDDVHVMAKTLLDKFETKWLQLLPKVDEEEERRREEEADMQLDVQFAQEAAYAKMTRELCFDLDEVDAQLEELRDSVLQKCRKMTTEEKKRLGSAITRLSPEDINKAVDIIAQNDPTFQAAGETVEVDIDAQSESTLWKLKFFVKDTLPLQMKSSTSTGGNINGDNNQNCNNKRKRDVPESLAKTAQKKSKKPPN
ncbi:transcription factor GTE6-like isoform X2 [Salvia splendens]|uniref:transcription factor GTE6-like isoform X2 n=1 Tax=Salvia splendens TaxID=180675 RepID=UPI001C261A32|nr:transcription factor GTE6-like isoform X2 [Salvia splendens]